MWRLAADAGLDLNSPYAYVLWSTYHAATSVVAVGAETGELMGFVTGFGVPDSPETLFIWQVAVAPSHRGSGVAGRMLDELAARTEASRVEATVTPSNDASAALFRSFAARHDAPVAEEEIYGAELFPGEHEAEVLFRIGPLVPLAAGVTN